MSETIAVDEAVKTYRGDSIESLLPQIREELGAEAVIVSRREGLIGGVGGFFQKRCVEVDARAGGARVDVYDEEPDGVDEAGEARGLSEEGQAPAGEDVASFSEPAPPLPPAPASGSGDEQHVVRNDGATREGLATAAVRELVDQAQPFAEVLREMEGPAEAEVPVGPPRAKVLREGLVAAGLGDDVAREVVDSVLANVMPFATPGRLRTLVRNELALRLPVAPAAAPGARTLVFVGPAGSGKTTAMEAIAAAHEAAGMSVTRRAIADPTAPHPGGLLLVDTPALWGGAEGLAEVAAALGALDAPEVHLVMRTGTAAGAAAELVEGLRSLAPNRLLLTGAGETGHLGGALDVAIRAALPLSFVAESPERIAPADPRDLAGRITP